MQLTPRLRTAVNRACFLHRKQLRKSGRCLPYIVHPFSVALLLSGYTNDEDIIIAALLHDVLEDCSGYGTKKMAQEFGSRVTHIVEELSHDPKLVKRKGMKRSWQERKDTYLAHLEYASKEALVICCADKIHNLLSMADAYRIEGDRMWRYFHSPPDKRFWFYDQVHIIMKRRLQSPLVVLLGKTIRSVKKALGEC